jgi:hypothetical protein
MGKFTTQTEAVMTARASISGLLTAPDSSTPRTDKSAEVPSLSRRRFFTLRRAL